MRAPVLATFAAVSAGIAAASYWLAPLIVGPGRDGGKAGGAAVALGVLIFAALVREHRRDIW